MNADDRDVDTAVEDSVADESVDVARPDSAPGHEWQSQQARELDAALRDLIGAPATATSSLGQLVALAPLPSFDTPTGLQAVDLDGWRDLTGVDWDCTSAASLDAGRRESIRQNLFFVDPLIDDRDPVALRESFGFDPCRVEAWVEVDQAGTIIMSVDSPDGVEAAVRSDPAWSSALSVTTDRGVNYFDWGDGIDQSRESGPMRRLPVGGQLAIINDTLVRTMSDVHMRSVVERVDAGDASVLSTLTDLATGRGALAVYARWFPSFGQDTARFIADGSSPITPDPSTARSEPEVPRLNVWLALAAGLGIDTAGEYLDVVLLHPSGDEAVENEMRMVTVLEQGESARSDVAWSDLFRLESIEVDGALLIARLRTSTTEGRPGQLLQWLRSSVLTDDTLLAVG